MINKIKKIKKRYILFIALAIFFSVVIISVITLIFTNFGAQKEIAPSCSSGVITNRESLPEEGENIAVPEEKSLPTESQSEIYYFVSHVVDGDTFSVNIDGKTKSVRLIGINTPETSEKYRSKECFGEEATKRTVELLGGKQVKLEADPTQADTDQYGRILRYAFLEDGTFVNQLLVEEGFAKEYTFKGSEYKYQKEFRLAQSKAKEEAKGLWGSCGAIKN